MVTKPTHADTVKTAHAKIATLDIPKLKMQRSQLNQMAKVAKVEREAKVEKGQKGAERVPKIQMTSAKLKAAKHPVTVSDCAQTATGKESSLEKKQNSRMGQVFK